ncbi:MAG: formylglycine-generating enzyme family protein [Bacteroidia bacterium]
MKHKYFLFLVAFLPASCQKMDAGNFVENVSTPSVFIDDSVKMKHITGGSYKPLYGKDSADIIVHDFLLDEHPVTNMQYKKFVMANPQWRRSAVKKIFADGNYLKTWDSDTSFPANIHPNAPVTNISWYAAEAYATSVGKRLPNIDEWEYVGMADETNYDARINKSYNEAILAWYEKPRTFGNEVAQNAQNKWEIYDMHGLVWEWIQDFNSVLMSGESRKDGATDRNLFCGSASLGASDLMNYAAFMRYAFRGSLKANYCIQNLGFRCAKDIKNKENE